MSLQKIANVIPTAAVKQSAKVLGPLVFFLIYHSREFMVSFNFLWRICLQLKNSFQVIKQPTIEYQPNSMSKLHCYHKWHQVYMPTKLYVINHAKAAIIARLVFHFQIR